MSYGSKVYNENIDSENERLNKYIKNSEKELHNLLTFFDEIYLECSTLHKSINKKLIEIFDVGKVSDVTTKLEQNMKFFYQTSQMFLKSFSEIMEKFNIIIITPFKIFLTNYENENINIRKELNSLTENFKYEKDNLMNYQNKYYLSVKNLMEFKNKINEKKSKNLGDDFEDDEKEKDNEELCKLKSIIINNKHLYKYQIKATNIFYNNYDMKYKNYYKLLEENESGKLVFLSNTFRMYSNNVNELANILKDFVSQINIKFGGWKLEEDNALIKEEFNYIGRYISSENINNESNVFQRFNKEVYMVYNDTNMNFVNNYYDYINNKKNQTNNKEKSTGLFGILKGKTKEVTKLESHSETLKNTEYQLKIMNNFFKGLDSPSEIPPLIMSNLNELICIEKSFPSLFIKTYLSSHKGNYTKIPNELNLRHFGHALNNIFVTCLDLDKKESFTLMIYIIYIGQHVYCNLSERENNKIFLCSLLKKIHLFKCLNFWDDILKFKIKISLKKVKKEIEEKADIIYKIKKRRASESEKITDEALTLDTLDELNSTVIMANNDDDDYNYDYEFNAMNDVNAIKKGLKNLMSMQGAKIKLVTFIKFEEEYEILTEEYKNEFLSKSLEHFHNIISEYMPAFINYNFGVCSSTEFLVKICNEFEISLEAINYYIISLNMCSYSIKQYSKNSFYDLKNKIEDAKASYKNLVHKDSLIRRPSKKIKNQKKRLKLSDDEKILILLKASDFLTFRERIHFFKLNKNISKVLGPKLYKNILNITDKKLGITLNKEMHLDIWRILLKYKEIKQKFPYEINKKKALSIKYEHSGNCDYHIIDLDCTRTFFENSTEAEIERKRTMINNVLKTVVLLNNDSNYCQGMNFVSAFLIKICKSEEDCFYLMMGLFRNTSYKSIFLDDLKKLRLYFSIFDRILYLIVPTIHSFFKTHKILTNYYLSSWFITLFTSYANKEQCTDVFIKIFDLFIIQGWKSVFNIAVDILKQSEEALLLMKYENLMYFINNNLGNLFLFNPSNYNRLEEKYKKIKITQKFINGIEKQLLYSNEASNIQT